MNKQSKVIREGIVRTMRASWQLSIIAESMLNKIVAVQECDATKDQ